MVNVRDGDALTPALLKLMIEVARSAVSRPTLDDVFLKYTARIIQSEEGGGEEFAQAMRPWLGLRRGH